MSTPADRVRAHIWVFIIIARGGGPRLISSSRSRFLSFFFFLSNNLPSLLSPPTFTLLGVRQRRGQFPARGQCRPPLRVVCYRAVTTSTAAVAVHVPVIEPSPITPTQTDYFYCVYIYIYTCLYKMYTGR